MSYNGEGCSAGKLKKGGKKVGCLVPGGWS